MRAIIGMDGSTGSLTALQFAVRLMNADKDELSRYYSPP
jgi:hypothetical protein